MPIIGIQSSAGMKPSTPTIGTASDGGTGTTASVAFTPSTYIGKSTITYTALSSPGSLTGTGSGSPITVSGLTTGTAYTFTVKGDTNYGVASDYSAASNSVTPASPSSFESIATVTVSSGSVVSFTSIPSTYKSLQIRGMARGSVGQNLKLQFNSDTTAGNYTGHTLYGTGSVVRANQQGADTYISVFPNIGVSTYTSVESVIILDIIDYASTTKNKTTRSFNGRDNNGSDQGVQLDSGLWMSTSAINRIDLTMNGGTYATGTTFALYGVK